MADPYKKLNGMSREFKLAFLSSGNVTVGELSQIIDGKFKTFYVAKLRGVIVGNKEDYKHETPDAARAYGKQIRLNWRMEMEKSNG